MINFFGLLTAAVFASCLMTVTSAYAAPVSFSFVAERARTVGTLQPGSLATLADPFSTISGTFGYDTAALDIDPSSTFGNFGGAFLTIDQFALPSPATTGVTTGNDFSSRDAMAIYFWETALATRVFLNFEDLTATAFDDDALPTDLALHNFASIAEIGFFSAQDSAAAYFNLTSLQRVTSPTPVPLPSGILLMLTSLGLLTWRTTKS